MSVIILDPVPEEEEENLVAGYKPGQGKAYRYADTVAGLSAAIEHLRQKRDLLFPKADDGA